MYTSYDQIAAIIDRLILLAIHTFMSNYKIINYFRIS